MKVRWATKKRAVYKFANVKYASNLLGWYTTKSFVFQMGRGKSYRATSLVAH